VVQWHSCELPHVYIYIYYSKDYSIKTFLRIIDTATINAGGESYGLKEHYNLQQMLL
jgi:hypothetical protein